MRTGRRRDDVVLATQVLRSACGPNPWDAGNSRKHMMRGDRRVAAPARHRLRRPVPAALLRPATRRSTRRSARSTTSCASGKVRYVGCSNFLAYQLARAIGRSEVLGLVRFESVQPRYNLLFREIERELLPLCAEEGIGVIPYNPIAGGLLTGKHRPGAPTEGTRFTLGTRRGPYQDRYWHDRDVRHRRRAAAARRRGRHAAGRRSPSPWVLANPVITAPIIGASRPEQLDDVVAAVDAPSTPTCRRGSTT